MKTENIINLAVGGAVLFGAVWLVSKAWKKGQGNGQETMSEFRGKRANPRGFAGLNRGVSPSGGVIKSSGGSQTYTCTDADGNTISGTFPNGAYGYNQWMTWKTNCAGNINPSGVTPLGGRIAKRSDTRVDF
jgi:hypothetical protein